MIEPHLNCGRGGKEALHLLSRIGLPGLTRLLAFTQRGHVSKGLRRYLLCLVIYLLYEIKVWCEAKMTESFSLHPVPLLLTCLELKKKKKKHRLNDFCSFHSLESER